jgi:hypothetical protein
VLGHGDSQWIEERGPAAPRTSNSEQVPPVPRPTRHPDNRVSVQCFLQTVFSPTSIGQSRLLCRIAFVDVGGKRVSASNASAALHYAGP